MRRTLAIAIATVLSFTSSHGQSSLSLTSALNLIDRTDFFVCESHIYGMNGHYVISEELQSDPETPVFVREDEDTEEELQGQIVTTNGQSIEHDFRLYRHNGFWMFADVASWPPQTVFRCDPTKRNLGDDVNALEACSPNLPTPPKLGYTPANAHHSVQHLILREVACDQAVESMSTPAPFIAPVTATNEEL